MTRWTKQELQWPPILLYNSFCTPKIVLLAPNMDRLIPSYGQCSATDTHLSSFAIAQSRILLQILPQLCTHH